MFSQFFQNLKQGFQNAEDIMSARQDYRHSVIDPEFYKNVRQGYQGPDRSVKGNKNYDAEYNQRNQTKVTACNVHGNGNMGLFNNKVNMIETNKELCNNRQTPFYNPQMSQINHPSELLGEFTNMPQQYENKQQDNMDSSLLQAFKNNPYTQSLQSVI